MQGEDECMIYAIFTDHNIFYIETDELTTITHRVNKKKQTYILYTEKGKDKKIENVTDIQCLGEGNFEYVVAKFSKSFSLKQYNELMKHFDCLLTELNDIREDDYIYHHHERLDKVEETIDEMKYLKEEITHEFESKKSY